MELVGQIRNDIEQYLASKQDFWFNEDDLQHGLAMFLEKTGHYDKVLLEYYLPKDTLPAYSKVWDSDVYIDMVVSKNGEFVPIELKYRTCELTANFIRFGEDLGRSKILQCGDAMSKSLYEIWKDVRRLECVKARFNNVHGGLFVLVSCNKRYFEGKIRPTTNHINLSTLPSLKAAGCHWLRANAKTALPLPGFDLDHSYPIEWVKMNGLKSLDFKYMIIGI